MSSPRLVRFCVTRVVGDKNLKLQDLLPTLVKTSYMDYGWVPVPVSLFAKFQNWVQFKSKCRSHSVSKTIRSVLVVHAILGVSRVQSFEANLLIFADFGHSQDRMDAVFSLAHLCRLRERDFGQGIYGRTWCYGEEYGDTWELWTTP